MCNFYPLSSCFWNWRFTTAKVQPSVTRIVTESVCDCVYCLFHFVCESVRQWSNDVASSQTVWETREDDLLSQFIRYSPPPSLIAFSFLSLLKAVKTQNRWRPWVVSPAHSRRSSSCLLHCHFLCYIKKKCASLLPCFSFGDKRQLSDDSEAWYEHCNIDHRLSSFFRRVIFHWRKITTTTALQLCVAFHIPPHSSSVSLSQSSVKRETFPFLSPCL